MSASEGARPASVLFVSQKLPWPLSDGGNQRTFHLLAALAARRPLTLVSTGAGGPEEGEAREALEPLCSAVHLVRDVKPTGVLGRARTLLSALAHGEPAVLRHNRNPLLLSRVGALLAEGGFDRVHLNHVDVHSCLPRAGDTPHVVDSHNLLWVYYERAAALARNPFLGALQRREARLLAERELAIFRGARVVLVCSDTERELLLARDPALRVEVIPNGADCSRLTPRDGDRHDPKRAAHLCFVGDMAYAPNADGARWFIDEVMPLLRGRVAGLRFVAVGKDPPPDLLERGRAHADVELCGFVPDAAEVLARAAVCVVPLRHGAGTRLKVLEAFALGLPTVSTRLGAEGIACTDGADILLADTPTEMAETLARLLADRTLRRSLGEAARRTALERYDWSVIGERLAGVYDALDEA